MASAAPVPVFFPLSHETDGKGAGGGALFRELSAAIAAVFEKDQRTGHWMLPPLQALIVSYAVSRSTCVTTPRPGRNVLFPVPF
jgi:hypothetical protein